MEFSSSYLASQVLKLFWNYKIPVDIQSIAKKLEIESTINSNLDNKFLSVNGSSYANQQRLIIAHYIGHHVISLANFETLKCKCKAIDSNNYFNHYLLFDKTEKQAHQIAYELLMPEIAVNHLIMKENISDIDELTKWFLVEYDVMFKRLKQLNWL